ncbi:DUF4224 domain-containing protein [Klebsiella pneumoniae]|nr:DUF4224 domain-containing protein [Klebsiella pneumoniae]MCP5868615.1 DUF4224 domain-containing protein [Klebsiella pneumoniae]MCP6344825.1 DUF4224 domain-containing protein [Klebsiella pneumoniae]
MNLDNEIISNADLERITGYKIPSKQSQCLRDAGDLPPELDTTVS